MAVMLRNNHVISSGGILCMYEVMPLVVTIHSYLGGPEFEFQPEGQLE
jgi:hypothetical protein